MPTPVCRARAYRAADESKAADISDEEFESTKQKLEPK